MSELEQSSMNFFDHIKELRQKLMYSIIFFLISFVVSFYFSQSIFEFLAKPLTSILPDGNGLIYTALQEAFLTNVKVAFFTAAFISFPFLSIQIWSFVAPGFDQERKTNFITNFDRNSLSISIRSSSCLLCYFANSMEVFFEFSNSSS
jgi:sec-independent protein translocase protein TatC